MVAARSGSTGLVGTAGLTVLPRTFVDRSAIVVVDLAALAGSVPVLRWPEGVAAGSPGVATAPASGATVSEIAVVDAAGAMLLGGSVAFGLTVALVAGTATVVCVVVGAGSGTAGTTDWAPSAGGTTGLGKTDGVRAGSAGTGTAGCSAGGGGAGWVTGGAGVVGVGVIGGDAVPTGTFRAGILTTKRILPEVAVPSAAVASQNTS